MKCKENRVKMKDKNKGIVAGFRGTLNLILWDWSTLLLFELLFKLSLLLLLYLEYDLLVYAMRRANLVTITNENLHQLLSSPTSIFLVLLLFFSLATASLVELGAVLAYFQDGMEGRRTGVKRIFCLGLKGVFSLFHLRKLMLFPLFLLLLPLTGFGVFPGPFSKLSGWEILLSFVHGNPVAGAVYTALTLVLCYLLFYRLFNFQEMLVQGRSFREASHRSRTLIRSREGRLIGSFLLWALAAALGAGVLYLAAGAAVTLSVKLIYSGGQLLPAFWYSWLKLQDVGAALLSIYVLVSNLGFLTFQYHRYSGEEEARLRSHNTVIMRGRKSGGILPMRKRSQKERMMILARFIMLFVMFYFYTESVVLRTENALDLSGPQIVSYSFGVDTDRKNAVAVVTEARISGAAYAKIDVEQGSDGMLMVVNNPRFPVAAEDMLRVADGRIGLMIELKKTGGEEDLAETAAALIREREVEKGTVIASGDYALLQRLKELEPGLRTIYMAAACGDFRDAAAADMFSVEEALVTKPLIAVARQQGKPLYARTAGGEASMRRLAELGVDGIVTNNPYLAGYVVQTEKRDMLAEGMARRFFPSAYAAKRL